MFFIENSFHEAFEMEETLNFDVLTCSQGSDLDQEQLNEIEQKAQAKSTKKATEWGQKSERTGKENACFPLFLTTQIFK